MKKRLSLIIACAAIAVIISGVVSYFFITPIYQATTQILVNQEKSEQVGYNAGDVQTNLQLINTYNVIIKSSAILEKVAQKLDNDLTAGQLNGKITVQSENNSQVVNISVQDPDPNMAAEIANTTAETFQTEIVNLMKIDNVSIIAPAKVGENQSPIKPQPLLNIAIALVVGLMAGVGVAFLLEYLDSTVKDEQDIEKILGLPVLGAITIIDSSQNQRGGGRQQAKVRGENFGS